MNPAVVAAVLGAGVIGALLRYGTSTVLAARKRFPYAVLIVNVAGSAVAGVVAGLAERAAVSADGRLILITGFCGGLTTFSTFATETVQLVLDGRARVAAASVALNLVVGIAVATAGYLLIR
jgi:fluoride exporter